MQTHPSASVQFILHGRLCRGKARSRGRGGCADRGARGTMQASFGRIGGRQGMECLQASLGNSALTSLRLTWAQRKLWEGPRTQIKTQQTNKILLRHNGYVTAPDVGYAQWEYLQSLSFNTL